MASRFFFAFFTPPKCPFTAAFLSKSVFRGILRAISPAGRRFRALALVSGRKNHDVYAYMCTFSLSSLFVTHDFYRACLTGFPTS